MHGRYILGMIVMACVAATGCSAVKGPAGTTAKSWNPKTWFEQEYQTPESLAVIWSPDVINVPGKPLTRGFGGRIYFYNAKSQAVPVNGELIVHGYLTTDDRSENPQWQVEADKTFAFTAEQLTSHFSPSQLGASYSIWIPWDEAGGYREEVTLVPTFKSHDGHLVQGAPARVYLPGKAREGDAAGPSGAPRVSIRKTATPAYEIVPPDPIANKRPRSGLQTTTITIPSESNLLRGSVRTGGQVPDSPGGVTSQGGSARPTWELTPPASSNTPKPETIPSEEAPSRSKLSASGSVSAGSTDEKRPSFQLQPWTERRDNAHP